MQVEVIAGDPRPSCTALFHRSGQELPKRRMGKAGQGLAHQPDKRAFAVSASQWARSRIAREVGEAVDSCRPPAVTSSARMSGCTK